MQSHRVKSSVALVLFALAGYLLSYAVLWTPRPQEIRIMTDRGCISATRQVRALRFATLDRGAVRDALTLLYRPVNALLDDR